MSNNAITPITAELILPQVANDMMLDALAAETLQQVFTNGVIIGAVIVIVSYFVGKIAWNVYSSRRGSQ